MFIFSIVYISLFILVYSDEKTKTIKYLNDCNKGILYRNKIDFNKVIISVIIPTYNRGEKIKSTIRSIQNNNFDNIEILLLDDNSNDNTIQIIEDLMKEDKRIKLIKHEKKQSPLQMRIEGAIKSSGDFIMYIDSDDYLINDIINKTYNIAKNTNLDIVEFNKYYGELNNFKEFEIDIKKNEFIYQPELSYIMFYKNGKGTLKKYLHSIWGKLIKKNVLIDSIKYLKHFANKKIIMGEDSLQLFSLLRVANNFTYLTDMGVFYSYNYEKGKTLSTGKETRNIRTENLFYVLEFYNDFTGDSFVEKDVCCEQIKALKPVLYFKKLTTEMKININNILVKLKKSFYLNRCKNEINFFIKSVGIDNNLRF